MSIISKSDKQTLSVPDKKLFWSIFILVLVHFAGAMGMAFYDAVLFSSMTPYNLLLVFVLLLWNETVKDKILLYAFLIAFVIGLSVELIGVNTQLLFGHYTYGEVLGFKFLGVPLLIGVNWFIIVYSNFLVAAFMLKNTFINKFIIEGEAKFDLIQSLVASLFALFFDWLMEPVALKLNFWYWENSVIPSFNYICWFLFSLLISLLFVFFKVNRNNKFAISLIVVQIIFFIFLRIFLK